MTGDRGSLSWDELDLAHMRDELADVEWAIREAQRFGRSPELYLLDRRTILTAEIARREAAAAAVPEQSGTPRSRARMAGER